MNDRPTSLPGVLRRLVGNTLRFAVRNVAVLAWLREQIRLRRPEGGIGLVIDGADIVPLIAEAAMSTVDGHARPRARPAGVEVAALAPIPYPIVDLSIVGNPLRLITDSPEFALTDRFFDQNPASARSLMSARSQALIYALIRNLKPEHVIEIGTYHTGTSEAICRALHANGSGMLHTTDPFCGQIVIGTLRQWPAELREHIRFYALNSMAFYAKMAMLPAVCPLLAFIDGNHDRQYAAFDIESAANIVGPGGFIVVDNMVQAGPYLAASDFLATHPGWTECALAECRYDPAKPFDRERCSIPGTELMILRAPQGPVIGERPVSFPEIIFSGHVVNGIEILPGRAAHNGVLHAQCIVRGFSSGQKPVEELAVGSTPIAATQGGDRLRLATPLDLDLTRFEHARLEIWLSWAGEGPLPLLSAPTVY
jgi:hypothetical protein